MLKQILDFFRRPYTVIIHSRDLATRRNPRGTQVHLASNMREARAWVDCYDFHDAVTIIREGLFRRRVVATELTL